MSKCKIHIHKDRIQCIENKYNDIDFGENLCTIEKGQCELSDQYDINTIKIFINPSVKQFIITSLFKNKKMVTIDHLLEQIANQNSVELKQISSQDTNIIKTEYRKLMDKYMKKQDNKIKLSFSDMFNELKTQIKYDHQNDTIIVTDKNSDHILAEYEEGEVIGEGVNGDIYEFNIKDTYKHNVVPTLHTIVKKQEVKVDIEEGEQVENEYSIAQKMKDQHKKCDVVELRKIYENYDNEEKETTFIYIMNKLRSDVFIYLDKLDNYIDDNNVKNKELYFLEKVEMITKDVYHQIHCLFSLDCRYVYADLKPGNVGIDYDDDMKITKVSLLDLGSVLPVYDDGTYLSTYPCKKHINGNLRLKDKKEKIKCIDIEILYFIFLCLEMRYYHYGRLAKKIDHENQFNKKNIFIILQEINKRFSDYHEKNQNNFIETFMKRFSQMYVNDYTNCLLS